MPPTGFRKRLRSASPAPTSTPHKKKAKKSLFETADAPSKKPKSVEENRKLLQQLGDKDEDSSLSEAESDDFEDVPPAKKQKTGHASPSKIEDGDDNDDEMDWEDAIQPASSTQATPGVGKPEREIGDLAISVKEDGSYIEPLVSVSTQKKGPSKRERQIRIQSHCLHVQALMWHNTVRNSWLNDAEVQKVLVDGLTEGVVREVQRWKEAMGMTSKAELEAKKKAVAAKNKDKGKGKGKKAANSKSGRDWAYDAEHAEQGLPNLSGGDPLLRLLKVLTAYWRKRFTVTAPALRKQGYKPLRRLRDDIRAWESNHNDIEESGERISSLQQFRKLAQKCEGSRDVGAQLFVALLRGLGLETRMVANLQPVGFGWSKTEEADAKKAKKKDDQPAKEEAQSEAEDDVKVSKPKPSNGAKRPKTPLKQEKPIRKSTRGGKADPIDLADSDSSLSSPPSEVDIEGREDDDDDDDLSVIDITPSTPTKKKLGKKYDRDMAFPHYWIEVCSPVSHKFVPVDPIVLSTIASNDELLQSFEPRGKKADKAKQVMAYTIGFNADGTAKDVTVRYLKRHQLPGKTKGMRMPAEKVPIYNRRGKVKRYEEYDWFRTLMSIYDRPEPKRTTADELEEQTDLKPFKPSKSEGKEVEKESLQWYKQSAEFVLEQHLRREEAIKPGAESVKTFTAGKGDKTKEHTVFRRDDVLVCKTVESWHKEGRELKMGEHPVKQVPIRAVTLIRKREIEDAQRETGEKPTQGLYHKDQTDWIIPPPIKDGHIPRNAFGNIDVYVPTMVPRGAIHLPLKGSVKICKKLEIDFAEACTGFEFGKQRAVPVLTGVVVAKENEGIVRDAWKVEREEQKRKEDTKRTTAALHWWRKMLLGLRVLDRMQKEYTGDGDGEESNPFVLKARREGRAVEHAGGNGDGAGGGGFFPEGMDVEEVAPGNSKDPNDEVDDGDVGGGFDVDDMDEGADAEGGFLVEEDPEGAATGRAPSGHRGPITPISLQSMHKEKDASAAEYDDGSEGDGEIIQPAPLKRSAKAKVNGNAKERASEASPNVQDTRTQKPAPSKLSKQRKRVAPTLDSDEQSSSSELSEPSDSSSDGSEMEAAPRRRRSSPQVVITPGSQSKGRAGRNAKKTPVKSQYFAHESSGQEDGAEESESEVEIIRPRGTTARTRRG